jgi:hypothetical protein
LLSQFHTTAFGDSRLAAFQGGGKDISVIAIFFGIFYYVFWLSPPGSRSKPSDLIPGST